MIVTVIKECGYEEAVLGFSLSYNSSIDRTKAILPRYAFGIPGESKFLESMQVWLDVTAPRFWWQEADTYRVGTSKQSESTMHTLMKSPITDLMFEDPLPDDILSSLINEWEYLKGTKDIINAEKILRMKNMLPEGFLQRRIWNLNYKVIQNIYNQRCTHKLPQWHYFLFEVTQNIQHPEFIIKEEPENV